MRNYLKSLIELTIAIAWSVILMACIVYSDPIETIESSTGCCQIRIDRGQSVIHYTDNTELTKWSEVYVIDEDNPEEERIEELMEYCYDFHN